MKAHAVTLLVIAVATTVLGACTSASPTSTAPSVVTTAAPVASVQATPVTTSPPVVLTPTAIVSVPPAATVNPTVQPTASPGGVAEQPSSGTLDPCALLSPEEASAVNGVTYGAGTAHTLTPIASECVWQTSSPGASVVLQLAQGATPDQAQTAYAEALAAQADFNVVDVPNLGDKAAIVRAKKLVTGGIYVLQGFIGFDVVYLNGTAPTDAQLVADAQLIQGRLP